MRSYSVVICSYNKLEYLQKVVDALRKTSRKIETILSDDGSTDETIAWAKSSGFFTHIITSDKSDEYRLNTVRNSGINAASSQHVVLLDADCAPEPQFFSGHDAVFDKFPDGMSVGFTMYYDKSGKKLLREDHRRVSAKKRGEEINSIGWVDSYGGNIAFPKALWEKVGGFDERYNGAWGLEDADFAYMAIQGGSVINTNLKTVARHLEHPLTGTSKMRAGKGPNTKKFKDKHGFSPC